MTELTSKEKGRLYDRSRPEYTQAKGHNFRVKERYPEAWANSTITHEVLADWIKTNKLLACPYCANPVKEIDHKQPLSKNGEHSLENLQMLCFDCNRSKHDMTDEEFRATRAAAPTKWRSTGFTLADYGIDKKILKDNQKRFRTRSLFKEMWATVPNKTMAPIFTLKGDDDIHDAVDKRTGEPIPVLISLKRLYLAHGDPTEYKFAKAVFGDPRHWAHLSRQKWFMEFLRRWRHQLKAELRSNAVEALIGMSESNLQAIKALATEDYIYTSYVDLEDKPLKRRAGRPNKEKIVEVISDETLMEDAARINLNNG